MLVITSGRGEEFLIMLLNMVFVYETMSYLIFLIILVKFDNCKENNGSVFVELSN